MTKFYLSPLLFCCSFFMLASCASTRYDTKSLVVKGPEANYISVREVSVGDWLTYMVTTSFTGDKKVSLGDHYDKVLSKLPALGPGRWDNYTFNAFLRKSQDNVSVDFYNECKAHGIKLTVAKTAWDTIRKFELMDLPVAGITYEQAMRYVRYKQDISNACGFSPKDTFRYECFLPTPEQFDSAQTILDSVNRLGCSMFNYKGSLCADCPGGKEMIANPVSSRTGMEPTSVWGYFPDKRGLKNFNGNVAEMTSVKGIAVGGSCVHYATEAFPGKRQTYTGSAGWLGLRIWFRRVTITP